MSHSCWHRGWGLKLAARGGKAAKKRAVVAVARKLAALLRRLWMTAEVYEPLRSTCSDRMKNEPNRPVRVTANIPLARGSSTEAAQQKAAPELDGPQHARVGAAGEKSANGSVAKGSLSAHASSCAGGEHNELKTRVSAKRESGTTENTVGAPPTRKRRPPRRP